MTDEYEFCSNCLKEISSVKSRYKYFKDDEVFCNKSVCYKSYLNDNERIKDDSTRNACAYCGEEEEICWFGKRNKQKTKYYCNERCLTNYKQNCWQPMTQHDINNINCRCKWCKEKAKEKFISYNDNLIRAYNSN
jgi:hypothetical protein